MEVKIKQELENLDRNDFDAVCDLAGDLGVLSILFCRKITSGY